MARFPGEAPVKASMRVYAVLTSTAIAMEASKPVPAPTKAKASASSDLREHGVQPEHGPDQCRPRRPDAAEEQEGHREHDGREDGW